MAERLSTKRLSTKLQCHLCGRYGMQRFMHDSYGRVVCQDARGCLRRWLRDTDLPSSVFAALRSLVTADEVPPDRSVLEITSDRVERIPVSTGDWKHNPAYDAKETDS